MTRHMIKPTCKYKCRFLQISDELWLCPHAAYGRLSYLKGAIEEGRRMLERAGGYDAVLRRIQDAEEGQRVARRMARLEEEQQAQKRVRYR